MDSLQLQTFLETQKDPIQVQRGCKTLYESILQHLETKTGALYGRFGTIEYQTLMHPTNQSPILERNAGVFPTSGTFLKDWAFEYNQAVKEATAMAAGWHPPFQPMELLYILGHNPQCKILPLRSLEPYYSLPTTMWTNAFANQNVTFVSSFADSMAKQYEKKHLVWPASHEQILPSSAKYSFVRSYYGPAVAQGNAQWPAPIQSWKDAVDALEAQVLATNPSIVVLGCGGLAMVLAKRLKAKNIITIVLGGAIQIMFGIKGKRWLNHDIIKTFFNSHWVFPQDHEIPNGAKQIEGGCYW
jgi:hypothetical protein